MVIYPVVNSLINYGLSWLNIFNKNKQELSLADKDKTKENLIEEAGNSDDLEKNSSGEETPAEGEDLKNGDPVSILEEKLKQSEETAKQNYDRLLRATAEFDNYKKRSTREMAEFRKFANESLIKELLPVIDNLERAVESSGLDANANKSVIEGVEMTLTSIFKVLEKFNLKALESEGKPFDPNFHQAVLQEATDEVPENTVVKVMQKGYVLHDRLIRPAMVVVSKAKTVKSEGQNTVEESVGQAD